MDGGGGHGALDGVEPGRVAAAEVPYVGDGVAVPFFSCLVLLSVVEGQRLVRGGPDGLHVLLVRCHEFAVRSAALLDEAQFVDDGVLHGVENRLLGRDFALAHIGEGVGCLRGQLREVEATAHGELAQLAHVVEEVVGIGHGFGRHHAHVECLQRRAFVEHAVHAGHLRGVAEARQHEFLQVRAFSEHIGEGGHLVGAPEREAVVEDQFRQALAAGEHVGHVRDAIDGAEVLQSGDALHLLATTEPSLGGGGACVGEGLVDDDVGDVGLDSLGPRCPFEGVLEHGVAAPLLGHGLSVEGAARW